MSNRVSSMMCRLLIAGLGIGVAIVGFAPDASAQTQWTIASGGNDHFYQVVSVPAGLSWLSANNAATAAGGYLATLTSAAENAFVFGLADNPLYWGNDGANNSQGPWLGGFQPAGSPEPAGGWQWVTGEPFAFTNWSGGEPNNSGGDESALQFFAPGLNNRAGTWNDVAHFNDINSFSPGVQVAYVIEFDSLGAAAPEPAALGLILLGAVPTTFVLRRRNR